MAQESFKIWMRKVDRELLRICGFTHSDLPDKMYSDMWADEFSPRECAVEVLEEEGFPG